MLSSTVKKIIFIFASLISISTYASNLVEQNFLKIDHKMLIGDWNCKEEMDYLGYDAKSNFLAKFRNNKIFSEKGDIKFKKENISANYKTEINGQWNIEDDILTLKDYKLLDFHTDNPEVESELNLKEALNDPDAVQFKIKKLTHKEMILNLILFEHEVDIPRICEK